MTDLLTRTYVLDDLEVRASQREITGLFVPFDSPTEIAHGVTEAFRRGAFTRTIAERGDRVKLLANHDRDRTLGRATHLDEEARGLVGTVKVSKTTAGDEALELVRDGALDSFSVGFFPVTGGDVWTRNRTHVDRIEVKLAEVSLTGFPAYDGARVESVRSASIPQLVHPSVARARLALAQL